MIIDSASFADGVFFGLDFDVFHSEFKNSKFSGKICGTLHNVHFEDCIFKDVVFDFRTSTYVEFVGCSFQNCIFTKNVKGQGVTFIGCKNRMNGILFR